MENQKEFGEHEVKPTENDLKVQHFYSTVQIGTLDEHKMFKIELQ